MGRRVVETMNNQAESPGSYGTEVLTGLEITPVLGPEILVGEVVTFVPGHVDRMHAWVEAFELWLASRRSPHTRRVHRRTWETFLAYTGKSFWEITRADVARWIDEQRQLGLAEPTLMQRVAALSSFYEYARDEYEITTPDGRIIPLYDANPASSKSLRHKVNPYGKARYLSLTESKALLNAIPRSTVQGLRDYALILFYLVTGRRNSEVRTLKWGAFEDFGERVWYRWSGKGKTDMRYECPRAAWTAIRAYLKAAGRLETMRLDDYIFTALSDNAGRLPKVGKSFQALTRPLSMREVSRLLKRYAVLGGLDPVKLKVHTLRHTAAMLRKESGSPVDEICGFLSHSSLAITQIYLHTVEGYVDTNWVKVEALLGL